MRKLFFTVACAAAVLFAGCDNYDDTELTGRVENLESRVAKLEELCKQMNTNISSLQTLVDALQSGDYITSVTPIVQGGETVGYTITFAQGSPITIYHGKDGAKGRDGYTPQIGVKQDTDGRYYWTLDGDWLLDDQQQKIPAEGRDGTKGEDGKAGADGIAPQFKIEDGDWYISTDEGQTWSYLGRATGENGKDGDKGQDGDSMFRDVDTSDPDYVTFTLADGTEIKLPRYSQLAIVFDEEGTIEIAANATRQIGYTVTGNLTDDVTVEALASGDVKAKIEQTTVTTGNVVITAGNSIDEEYTRVVVLVSEGDKTVVKNFAIAEQQIDIEFQFPDPIFRAYVLKNFDKDQDGRISKEEAAAVTVVDVGNEYSTAKSERIKSLQGVEYFTNLKRLLCSHNSLTELDVSHNPELNQLDCFFNTLTILDVTHNPALEYLTCSSNALTALDVSQNPSLKELYCSSNQLSTLDITKNPALEHLICNSNSLTELKTQNPVLTHLDCSFNSLTTLDVTKKPALENLYCSSNSLTTLDLRQNPALRILSCYSNSLTALDVSQNPALENLDCYSNSLTALETQNPVLKKLQCFSNQLTTLDVTKSPVLEYLTCSSNSLTELKTQNPVLTHLDCSSNSLTTLDVSQNPALENLYCYSNSLTALNVSQNTQLVRLFCADNLLTALDVSRTNLGNSIEAMPLRCSMETLQTLTLKQGWQISGIYPEKKDTCINTNTNIQFVE